MKIDAVVTWVDGNDPVHRAKRSKYASSALLKSDDVASDTRFAAVGEIEWCIASINRFAPWINKIYIVTDAQDPHLEAFLERNFPNGYIPYEIVDHKVIFRDYEEYLPTFNACSIESMTWRIPGLSDCFIEFNDDIILSQPLSVSDFFTEEGHPVCYAGKSNIPFTLFTRLFKIKSGGRKKVTFKGVQCNAALLGGDRWSFLKTHHTPKALRRDFYEQYFGEHPESLIRNIKYRLRDPDMYITSLLQYTILAKRNQCAIRPVKGNLLYMQPNGKNGYVMKKLNLLTSHYFKFVCFNSIDKATQDELTMVKKIVQSKLSIRL